MTRQPFEAVGEGVRLGGWVEDEGQGPPVLLLHGGPGLGHEYLDGLADDLGPGVRLASYQQRGLPPSSVDGPFTIARHVDDMLLVLDHLGWDRAVLVGHSWGGHLALHAAVAVPDRVSALLLVDTLGGVGDGGSAAFEIEMSARTPADVRQRADELDARAMRGEGTEAEALESLQLVWPSYFASRDAAGPMPPVRLSVPCYAGTWDSAVEELPRLEAALSSIAAPVGFLAGGASPMPTTASTDAAERIDGAWVETLDGVGHFTWLEAPGTSRPALDRVLQAAETGS